MSKGTPADNASKKTTLKELRWGGKGRISREKSLKKGVKLQVNLGGRKSIKKGENKFQQQTRSALERPSGEAAWGKERMGVGGGEKNSKNRKKEGRGKYFLINCLKEIMKKANKNTTEKTGKMNRIDTPRGKRIKRNDPWK